MRSGLRHGLGTRRVKIEGINTNITPPDCMTSLFRPVGQDRRVVDIGEH
ncbi:hypothetical protein BSU04_42890 [Caballeronia sordidicola]|uniref:Uncharacterized protein n=1 Tax=Caballeronia sordidicola TaxID=196367 RepID=A0A226WMG1_CABSO|nr:hypothetical protein BSU04_42890 [Caballeronia sordidicola]